MNLRDSDGISERLAKLMYQVVSMFTQSRFPAGHADGRAGFLNTPFRPIKLSQR